MYLELGKKNNPNVPDDGCRIWLNTDYIVRVDITYVGSVLNAKVITSKNGGSDINHFSGEDAQLVLNYLKQTQEKI
jgi:hypothetical protein